jgi:tRNA pseudouridine38-40 synthase
VRLKLTVEYDGTAFRGWARQPGARTVEGELRHALAQLYGRVDALAVAGRTDTGVHALGNVASVEVETGPPQERAAEALNGLLPHDVCVLAADQAPDAFDARFDAQSRSYRYRVWRRKLPSAFEARRALWHPRPLDLPALSANAAALVGTHDFTAFTPSETHHKRFTRTVHEARWVELEEDVVAFEITADSFLRHMVRTLVGSMLEGIDLAPLLAGSPRSAGGKTAPPHGLYLTEVAYGSVPHRDVSWGLSLERG